MAKDDEIFDLGNLDKGIEKISTLITRLNQADAELVNLSKNALSASKALGGISTPGGLSKSQGDNTKTLAELDKLKLKYAELEKRIAKLNETRKQTEKLNFQEKIDARIRLQNATAEAKAKSAEADAYQKLSLALAAAQKNAQAIGATWGSDSVQFKKASDAVRKLDDEIKKIDAGIGKHQRNVGNYASGWNGLGNSINQITREAPAAAVSLNTFFLAISNNLPMFFDEITKLKVANEELVKSGEKPISIWKQLGSAVFSFQTLLSVGVTLLTLYGGKLIEMAFGLGSVEAQLKKIEAQQAKYNRQLEDANRNIEHNLVLEKNRRKILGEAEKDLIGLDKEAALQKLKNFEITRDANKKLLDDRVKQISASKGFNTIAYSDEINGLEKLNAEKIRLEKSLGKELVKYTYLARTEKEKADVESLAKVNGKILVAETLAQDEIYLKRKEGYVKANNEAVLYGQQVSELFSNLALQQKDNDEERLADIAEMNRKDIELLIAKNNVLLDDEDSYYSERFASLLEDKRLRTRLNELDRDEELRLAKNSYEKQQIALTEFQIKKLELQQSYNKKRAELEKLDLDPIRELLNTDYRKDLMKPVSDSAKEATKELVKMGKETEKAKNALLKFQAVQNLWARSFYTDFASNSGFVGVLRLFDGENSLFERMKKGMAFTKDSWKTDTIEISEAAQEMYNFIANASQNNFNAEKTRLEEQYSVSLKYAGDNKAAQEKLNADLEAKKKDIANREAKAKKQQAIFNIAIDTAQAILGVWASPGFPAAIPLAIGIGVLGAAQIAMVAAQEIPQYWMGGTHDGGLMMVNDGKGSNYKETVITPDGNIHRPQGRNVIMDAPAGTKIFTHDQFNESLYDMMKGNGINMSMPQQQYSGISKDDMREAMFEAFEQQPQHHTNISEEGITTLLVKKGNVTKTISQRGNSTKVVFKR